jgi:hypothetical protein
MSLILAKAQDDARSVIRLSKSGYGTQAAALSRSLIESAINADYIQQDPEQRARAFTKSLAESNKRLAKRMKPHATADEMQSLIKAAEDIQTESNWPKTLRQRADHLPKPNYLYDVVYLMLSQLVHSDVATAAGRLSHGESASQFVLQVGPSNEWVPQALATCFIALHEIAKVAFSAYGLPQYGLEPLATEFQKLTREFEVVSA